MQLSRFVVTYRDVRPGEHVLFDVIQDHYVGIDDDTLEALSRWPREAPKDEDEALVQQVLTDEGLLVASPGDDDARLRRSLEASAEGMPGTMYVTLMPTLQCNLACHYCFQKEHPAFTRMKDPVEDSTVEWILRRVDAAASRRLLVHYFGGEPLTRQDFLLRTAKVFATSMAARGAVFEWEMTTNGVGLTVDFVKAMAAHGEGTIKVTLDGDKETHDAARVYRDGRGTFDEIFSSAVSVAHDCPEVKLRIGGNFKSEQRASYERLMDRLEAAGMKGRIDLMRFKPVIDTSKKECGTCSGCGQEEENAVLFDLNASVARRGLTKDASGDVTLAGPCELHWKNSYVIDPKGLVYKCPAVAGRPEVAVGTVHSDAVKQAPLLELRPWEQCGPCPYLPVCVGGCLGSKYLQTGRKDQVFCQKALFEESYRRNVARRYLAEFGDTEGA
jgi:uncharacterized protein